MAATLSDDVKKAVEQWKKRDTDKANLEAIEKLEKDNNVEELKKLFSTRLTFGTAGLRGPMRLGPAGLNNITIQQATQGMCVYLERIHSADALKSKGVVIGYDGRHHSLEFAQITAAVLSSHGILVHLFSEMVPTPFVPFCIQLEGALAGIMVTASHNPKDDNGYKVYWDNGSQIVSPIDAAVETEILNHQDLWKIDTKTLHSSNLVVDPAHKVEKAYYQQIQKFCFRKEENQKEGEKIVYTPMHGVGDKWATKSFEAFGLPHYVVVKEQQKADPEFPTVKFPNPEEGKGALQLAMNTAKANSASLIIANDPDADRCAAAQALSSGEWKILNGNEIGILLADWIWSQTIKKNPNADRKKFVMLNSTVSSKMLKAMADKEGFTYHETLTGFKWMGNASDALSKKGYETLFAFEEAIGYMVGDICRDKDGIRAAPVFAEMYYSNLKEGRNCVDQLNYLYKKYGFFATKNHYYFCYDPLVLAKIFKEIRQDGKYSKQCGRFNIKNIRDLTTGYDSQQPDHKAVLPVSTSTEMITFYFDNGGVATLRGSGTEPKLKYYIELSGDDPEKVVKELDELVEQVCHQFLQPEKFGLTKPSS